METGTNRRGKVSKKYLDISLGGSGWFAVLLVADEWGCMEPWQTGIGRYKTKEAALKEAYSWHLSDEIPLHPDLIPLCKRWMVADKKVKGKRVKK